MPQTAASTSLTTRPAVDVLVVDDVAEIRRLLFRALLRERLTVTASPSTLHALRALEVCPHLVVMTDLTMPGPDGIELLRVVARRWPSTRRILFSGYTDAELVLGAHAHRVIDKSTHLSRVVEIVLEELLRAQT